MKNVKKTVSLVLALMMLTVMLSIAPVIARAETNDGDYGYRVYEDGTAYITDYFGTSKTLNIPEEIDGFVVTCIDSSLLYGHSEITGISIPDSVTSIGANAFSDTAYYNNPDNWENGVLYIGKHLIDTDSSVSGDYAIKDGTISVAESAFMQRTDITGITIPDSVKNIDSNAFCYCTSLSKVDFGNGVTRIDDDAFSACTNLKNITLPDSLKHIGLGAFGGSGVVNASIGSRVEKISERAFSHCSNIENIHVDSNNEYYCSVDGNLFNKSMTELVQYSIGKSDESFTIPAATVKIDAGAFDFCENLKNINVEENNKYYSSLDGNLYNKNKTELIQYAAGKTDTAFSIPESVTKLGETAFYFCENLETITIPDGVNKIPNSSFYSCGIKSLEIPDSVTEIGRNAFRFCSLLETVTIPDSVQNIGNSAFEYCVNLSDITLSDSVSFIDYNTFNETEYYNNDNNWEDGVLYIGKHLIKADTSLSGKYIIKSGTLTISSAAFMYCSDLESVTIPDSVIDINSVAFCNCASLSEVSISDNVKHIGNNAFGNTAICNNQPDEAVTYIGNYAVGYNGYSPESIRIKDGTVGIADKAFETALDSNSLYIPASVTTIGSGILDNALFINEITVEKNNPVYDSRNNCNAIIETDSNTLIVGCRNTTIPDTVTRIGNDAFIGCYSPEDIPDSVKSIGSGAYQHNVYNNEYVIPDSVKSIEENAFSYSESLLYVTIGNGVESIDDYAFFDCKNLKNVLIPANVKSIGNYAFGYYNERKDVVTNMDPIKSESFVIYGYPDTEAESYANRNGFIFKHADEFVPPTLESNYGVYELKQINLDIESLRNTLANGLAQCKKHINIRSFNIPVPLSQALANFIYNEIPEYEFVIDHVYLNYGTRNVLSLEIEYNEKFDTPQKVEAAHSQIESAANKLLENIQNNDALNEAEKALLVHDRLSASIDYDYEGYSRLLIEKQCLKGRDSNNLYESSGLYGALINKKAVCAGYAKAYSYLMNKLGIKTNCVISKKLNHEWNVAIIDNKPYYVDVTWDDTSGNSVIRENFLRSLDGIIKTGHIPEDGVIDYPTEADGISIDDTTYDNASWDNYPIEDHKPAKTDISSWNVSGIKNKTYTGKSATQNISVKNGSTKADITVKYKNNVNVGTATVTIKGTGDYTGTIIKTFKITKASNPVKVTVKTTVSANAKKKTTVKKAITVKNVKGKVTYSTNNKKVTVKNGAITVAKGLKKAKTYKVKITISAKGNSNYKSKQIVKTIKIKVK